MAAEPFASRYTGGGTGEEEPGGGTRRRNREGKAPNVWHAGGFPTDSTLSSRVDSTSGDREGDGCGEGCQPARAGQRLAGEAQSGTKVPIPMSAAPVQCAASRAPSIEAYPIGKPGLTRPTPVSDPKPMGEHPGLPEGLLEVFGRVFLTWASHGFNVIG